MYAGQSDTQRLRCQASERHAFLNKHEHVHELKKVCKGNIATNERGVVILLTVKVCKC